MKESETRRLPSSFIMEEAFARRWLRQTTVDGQPHHKFDGQPVARLDGIQLSRHRALTVNALATDEELADPLGAIARTLRTIQVTVAVNLHRCVALYARVKSPTSADMKIDSAMAVIAKGDQILRYIFTQRTSPADVVNLEKL